jgi:hypothetical protein
MSVLCWNDAFRKIFHFNRFDSVKELRLFCNEFDFRHINDLARLKFLNIRVFVSELITLYCFVSV